MRLCDCHSQGLKAGAQVGFSAKVDAVNFWFSAVTPLPLSA